jgi:thioesterase domain-containing protein
MTTWPMPVEENELWLVPDIGINQIPQNDEAEPESIRSMAASYVDRLQVVYPVGPYKLLGSSFSGIVVHELAIELHRPGCVVERLIPLDPPLPANSTLKNEALDESNLGWRLAI